MRFDDDLIERERLYVGRNFSNRRQVVHVRSMVVVEDHEFRNQIVEMSLTSPAKPTIIGELHRAIDRHRRLCEYHSRMAQIFSDAIKEAEMAYRDAGMEIPTERF